MSTYNLVAHGAVACELASCSKIGTDLLSQGGSAADALIAVMLCVGTINSHHTGIGGGGFALVRTPEGKYEGVDCRYAAPAAAHGKMFGVEEVHCAVGGLSVAVPGELRAFALLHQRYGKLPWKKIFQPAIKLAREGFPINRDLHQAMLNTVPGSGHITAWYQGDSTQSYLSRDPTFAKLFAPDGELLPVGTIIKRPEFADTLEEIADKGVEAFYEGRIAEAMVESVRKAGGVMTLEDLKRYEIHETTPLSISYRGRKVTSTPAPSSGAIVLSALLTLSNFSDPPPPDSVTAMHRTVEAMKFAYGQRTIIGDPAFVPEVPKLQQGFLRPDSGKAIAEKIKDSGVLPPNEYNPSNIEMQTDNGTSHFVAADSTGLVISMTSTILLTWGSRIMCPKTGIVMNNGMEDFSLEDAPNSFGYAPTVANFIKPGKRPLSSQSPYIIENEAGEFLFAGGCAGGSRIISANIQCARNVLDYDMSAVESLQFPRLHHQLQPNVLSVEQSDPTLGFKGFSESHAAALNRLGHETVLVRPGFSNSCAVKYTQERGWEATGDPRKFESGGSMIQDIGTKTG